LVVCGRHISLNCFFVGFVTDIIFNLKGVLLFFLLNKFPEIFKIIINTLRDRRYSDRGAK